MQNTTTNRSFLFLGNFPVYNAGNGLTDGQAAADFTINGRILYEFDTISLRFDTFNGNPYLCQLASGRPFAVEFNIGGLAALIALIKNREDAPKGKFLPLAITAYNQNNTTYQTIGYVSINENSDVVFYASNGSQQNQFTVSGKLQIEMFISYLGELKELANAVLAHKEASKMGGGSRGYVSPAPSVAPATTPAPSAAPTATPAPAASPAPSAPATPAPAASPAPSVAPTASPAPSAAPAATPTPTASPAPSAAPVIDMPEIDI